MLLLGHVAKAEGSEYSGSTAWDAVTRSRWWLRRAADSDLAAGTPPDLLLSREKSNYSSTGETIRLKWEDGVLKPIDIAHMTPQQILSMHLHQGRVRQAFLDCLDKLTQQGRNVSHSPRAQNYAPKLMTGMPEAQAASRTELAEAMEKLFSEGRIKANEGIGKRPNRTPITGIARVT